ncbi:hypothetical protein [Streptomyces sp. NPDC051546]|uniref:hypothetical protein n=1 Tax=Streptomyces sp. NPDC051546 TaxID=3365655 RepID=UPI0037AACC87
MIDIELLMEELAKAGVTMVLKADHGRFAESGRFWTIVMSGPGLGNGGGIHTDMSSLQECLDFGLAELQTRPGDWEWLRHIA